ncbi:MAG: GNAT family N-acetyltransferase [Cyanobacteria bacterium J06638_20]
MNIPQLPDGYHLRRGNTLDRALLLKLTRRTYRELHSNASLAHLAETIDQYFSARTPVWFVEFAPKPSDRSPTTTPQSAIACIWIGTAIDQVRGDRHANVFLLYVAPEHRRRGIASVLMHTAEAWAKERGDRQITLQVFEFNEPAIRLYEKLGYQVQSLVMQKPLS